MPSFCGNTAKAGPPFSICPNVFVDYIGGMGNGGTPDLSDRFYFNGRKNFYLTQKRQNKPLNYNRIFIERHQTIK
ncbi:MAG: hypothetical protein IPL25_15175 [Saprospiraceae bacterium]|nr:hypothetical protein [Candidatus Vicinibacter affinis]